jgi:acyl-coenzyme A synthetase/AMP-(fatty) acid ligase
MPLGQVGEPACAAALHDRLLQGRPARRVHARRLYPTKDLVRIDADGYLYFVGRTGDMIKTNSANVSRLEVEAALNALPEVELSLVAGLPDEQLGEMVAAAVVPAAGACPTERDLQAALRDRISSFKIPRRIVFISHEDVPRTSTEKVRLGDLAELIAHHLDG